METTDKICEKNNIIPRVQFAIKKEGGGVIGTGPHKIEFVEDKEITTTDFKGKEIQAVRYKVKEKGVEKYFDIPVKGKDGEVHYFLRRMFEKGIGEGDVAVIEYKRKGLKGYYSLQKEGDEVSDEEIPVIEDEDYQSDIEKEQFDSQEGMEGEEQE